MQDISALFGALEERCFVLEPDRSRPMEISARFGRDIVTFSLSERIRQLRRRLTEEERKGWWNKKQEWTQTREATGELVFNITSLTPRCLPQAWQDEPGKPLEQQVLEVLTGFIVSAA